MASQRSLGTKKKREVDHDKSAEEQQTIECYPNYVSGQLGHLPYDVLVLLVFAFGIPPTTVHDWGVDICRRESVWLIEKRNNT